MRHFFLRDHHNFPVACIASAISTQGQLSDGPIEPDSIVAFAVAVHNPKDTFNRAMGRDIARARLQKRRLLHFVAIKPNVKANIMQELVDCPAMPIRVHDAARHWLSVMEAKARTQAAEAFVADTQAIPASAPVPCAEALDAYLMPPEEAAVIAERMAETIAVEPEAHFTVDVASPTDEDSGDGISRGLVGTKLNEFDNQYAPSTPVTPSVGIDHFPVDVRQYVASVDGLSGTQLEALMAEHPPEAEVRWTWGGSASEVA